MSTINIRDWEIWINQSAFTRELEFHGFYECCILPTLMAQQTVEFLAEKFEIHSNNVISVSRPPHEVIKQTTTSEEGLLAIRIYGIFNPSISVEENIADILNCIDSIALCVDFAFICQKIRFFSDTYGKMFIANRMRIGRGIAFEIEERDASSTKLTTDLNYYKDLAQKEIRAARCHYLTGLRLLSLEDEVSGLIDAAFMQFYQACEILCMDDEGSLEGSKLNIAKLNLSESRALQIIIHQVWRVRNKYFGHGDLRYNILANTDIENAVKVAKQVYVARYLCKKLIDISSPSKTILLREMMFFCGGHNYGNFTGSIQELETSFNVDFDRRKVKIYSFKGDMVEEYEIKSAY